ncbi:prolyl oligopeptidase family serine peptidase [Streptomyces sp. TRM43335]|uniref:Prolyl oligopeptidase family serine peptidase n=1 Tax=Streptomyces taklimakanensis TaxID=2569853 RepID=A0A6G2B8K6_9ACTN|nr:alpha/beta fold hydrolase [Streptomyces taklimakanensis]MTE18456.1 prolyl oligopeptidase family serine peptidase [Streptomyces taklimakanensis]
MSLRKTAMLTATTLLGTGTAAVVAGRYAAVSALRPSSGRSLPAGFQGPSLTVHATAAGRITLTRSPATRLPGTYALTGPGRHAVVGPVLDLPTTADTVVRRLERVDRGRLATGDRVRLTPQLHTGNPRDALGLDHTDVEIPGELGALPAWYLPALRDIWVIAVHGLGATREHPLNVLPFLHDLGLPVLVPAYRGDPGAPRSPDGTGHLGDSEWRDLDAAIRHAADHGARGVVLYGWSTGATMALRAAANSPVRDRVRGLILDSPVLDWRATLRSLAAARHVPGPLLPLAVRAAQGRARLDHRPRPEVADPATLELPTLLLHGPDDTVAPWEPSRELAERRPDLVSLHIVRQAPHAAMWNADPRRYEEALRRFLTPLM